MLFSQAPCRLFSLLPWILSPAAHGQTYGIIFSRPFSIQLSRSQINALCVCGRNTRISTVSTCGVGSPSCSVWLFNTLFNHSIVNRHFLIFPASKKGFPEKRLFVSRFCGFRFLFRIYRFLFVFLFTDFCGCVPVWKSINIFSFVSLSVCRPSFVRLQFNTTTKILILQIFFFEIDWKSV